jgi:amt: ammonium transporter
LGLLRLSSNGSLGMGWRFPAGDGSHRLCGWYRGSYQCRCSRSGHGTLCRQAWWLPCRSSYHTSQHHLRVHGYVIPLVGMVRFQCR